MNARNLFLTLFLLMLTMITKGIAQTSVSLDLEQGFSSPAQEYRPETWFHLIGGNVSKQGLTVDLEAVSKAGIQGIQLFHGRGQEWPGVSPQITCLSESWDDMISHVGNETERLGLKFTMQNCPGWAMSGGPWITPDRAMRHLIWSRQDIIGGKKITLNLTRPQPSDEDWRDYREVAVLAFPTPAGDTGLPLSPARLRSNRQEQPWADLLDGNRDIKVEVDVSSEDVWLEIEFDTETLIRAVELPPVENLMKRRNFDPSSAVRLLAWKSGQWHDTGVRQIPRGTWQDRQPEMSLFLAFSDFPSTRFRLVFENNFPMSLTKLRFYSDARINDWRGQAGYALRSLERVEPPLQNRDAWLSSESIIDLSDSMDEKGALSWEAPSGRWTVLRFGHVNTGVKNKPAPPEATGFECDKLSPLGAEQHFAGYIGRLTQNGGAIEGQLKGMLIDSWECYTQTWTTEMEKEFETRRGYALRKWLPAVAGWVVNDHKTSEAFLRDWRATISDLLVENYFGRMAELGRDRGLRLSFETALGDVSPGDILQYFSKADIPMCELWQPNDPHWGGFETKPIHPTVSAGHIYGKPVIAAEAFTNIGIRWNEHPFALKHRADQHFALGINYLVFHTYTHNPKFDVVPGSSFGSRIGTPFLRGQTWWKFMPLFSDYLSRCQFLLQQGKPVADVLWYLGDDLDHKPRQDTPFPPGYQFDYINFDALLNRISVNDGMLTTPEGIQWSVLWLPELTCSRLLPQTLACLLDLIKQGATVIGPAPVQNPSLSGGDKAEVEFDTLVRKLWEADKPTGERRIGKGRLIWGNSLSSTLADLNILPDVSETSSAMWCHRRIGTKDIYFLAADRISPINANLRFRAMGQPEFWDPVTGERTKAAIFSRNETHTVLPVDLPAAGSVFVVFNNEKGGAGLTKIEYEGKIWKDAFDVSNVDTTPPYPNFGLTPEDTLQPWINPSTPLASFDSTGSSLTAWKDGEFTFNGDIEENKVSVSGTQEKTVSVTGTNIIEMSGPWKLAFPRGWDAPEQLELPELLPWSSLNDQGAKGFSGTASYSTIFEIAGLQKNERFMLDLGRVAHIAEVRLNGKDVSTLWVPPFRADITDFIRAGRNRLTVNVTSTWYNRLIFDSSLPEDERRTWTHHAPSADEEPEIAGLVGPVVIRIGKVVNR